jgi:hypothetical protein
MSYGHAERNLAQIRRLEAETRQLAGNLAQPMVSSPQSPSVPTAPAHASRTPPLVLEEQP